MDLETAVIQERAWARKMHWELAERWAEEIPLLAENDPETPEWRSTPHRPLDLSSHGFGEVIIKDESDAQSNPTGTVKDRAAWELVTLYRDFARGLLMRRAHNTLLDIGRLCVPTFSYVTAGNVGRAVSTMFSKYDLPPMKLLVDTSMTPERLEKLRGLHADIYMTDLRRKALSAEEIKALTNNADGIDITSVMSLEPHAILYDWHVHEAFNEAPDQIFIPYGSGRLMENYLTWQMRNARTPDPRLGIPPSQLLDISILGAESREESSLADKLIKHHNPFVLFGDDDARALQCLAFTGDATGRYGVDDEHIQYAYDLLRPHCSCEPSACAGLALYLQRYEQGMIGPQERILVVNTGKGI